MFSVFTCFIFILKALTFNFKEKETDEVDSFFKTGVNVLSSKSDSLENEDWSKLVTDQQQSLENDEEG